MGRACIMDRVRRNTYWILVGKSEEKGPLGRPSRRWGNKIKMVLRKIK
jgi:hypothetical protein